MAQGFDVVIYLLTLGYLIHNSYKYLYKQRRYTLFLVLIFYLLSFAVIVSRLLWIAGIYMMWYIDDDEGQRRVDILTNNAFYTATYFKLILGFY